VGRVAYVAVFLQPGTTMPDHVRRTGDEVMTSSMTHSPLARLRQAVEGPTRPRLLRPIKNLRFNALRHKKVVQKYEGVRAVTRNDRDPLDQAADPRSTDELMSRVYYLCGDDEEFSCC